VATDFVIRTVAPRWLELAKLPELAAQLRALPEVKTATMRVPRGRLRVVREQAWKARDEAWRQWRETRAKLGRSATTPLLMLLPLLLLPRR
jgi:hypothetical protein